MILLLHENTQMVDNIAVSLPNSITTIYTDALLKSLVNFSNASNSIRYLSPKPRYAFLTFSAETNESRSLMD